MGKSVKNSNPVSLKDSDGSGVYSSVEAPLVLGVAVIGLLLGCVLYHMCYRKFCSNRRLGNSPRSPARGQRTSEARTNATNVSFLFRRTGRSQDLPRSARSVDSLPDYYDLPPSYLDASKFAATKIILNRTSMISVSSTVSDDSPPAYDDVRSEISLNETIV